MYSVWRGTGGADSLISSFRFNWYDALMPSAEPQISDAVHALCEKEDWPAIMRLADVCVSPHATPRYAALRQTWPRLASPRLPTPRHATCTPRAMRHSPQASGLRPRTHARTYARTQESPESLRVRHWETGRLPIHWVRSAAHVCFAIVHIRAHSCTSHRCACTHARAHSHAHAHACARAHTRVCMHMRRNACKRAGTHACESCRR